MVPAILSLVRLRDIVNRRVFPVRVFRVRDEATSFFEAKRLCVEHHGAAWTA